MIEKSEKINATDAADECYYAENECYFFRD
jgi:hypothetical protein